MKDSKIKAILNTYDQRRSKAESDLEQRILDVYAQIPRIEEIDNEINKIGLKLARLALLNPSNKNELVHQCKSEIEILTNEKDQLLEKNQVPNWYLNIQYKCNICKDKGFLTNGHKCNCLKQEIVNEVYKMSNLSRVLNKENFANFDLTLFSTDKDSKDNISPFENMDSNILPICNKFINDFEKDNGDNLLLYGDTGVGKTFVCNCIAKSLLDSGYLVIYQTAFKMFEIIEEYKFKSQQNHLSKENYENLFECDLLIIDDLGTELTNSFTNSELFNILNTRLLSGKKTIISTNLNPMQLNENYAIRIFSRILDRFTLLKFIGKDLRWEAKGR